MIVPKFLSIIWAIFCPGRLHAQREQICFPSKRGGEEEAASLAQAFLFIPGVKGKFYGPDIQIHRLADASE